MDHWYSFLGIFQPFSSISHFAGALVFFLMGIFLVHQTARNGLPAVYVALFAGSLVLQLVLSGFFHIYATGTPERDLMHRLDVSCIFVLIAGSFSAWHGLLFKDWRRWGVLGMIWFLAIGGIALRMIFFEMISKMVGTLIFIGFGWLGILSFVLVLREYGFAVANYIGLGGLSYTIGGVANILDWPILIDGVWAGHETLHLFVLGGMAIHWYFVGQIVDGKIATLIREPDKAAIVIASDEP